MTKKSAGRKARDAQAAHQLRNRQLVGTAGAATVTRMSPAERLKARSNFNNRTNTCWDDTNRSKEMIRHSLSHCAALTKELIDDRTIVPYVDDKDEYAERVRSVTQDINQLVDDYELATKAHEGLTGGSKDPEDVMRAIQINELYFGIQNKLANVVHPMLSSISAAAGVARTRQAYDVRQKLEAKREAGTIDETETQTLAVVTEVTQGLEEISSEMEAARKEAQTNAAAMESAPIAEETTAAPVESTEAATAA